MMIRFGPPNLLAQLTVKTAVINPIQITEICLGPQRTELDFGMSGR